MPARLTVSAKLLFIFLIVSAFTCGSDEHPTSAARSTGGHVTPPAPWPPGAGHPQIPLWPRGAPHARAVDRPEVAGTVVDSAGREKLVGGRPWIYVDGV